jgi:hypothetical protein
MEQSKTKKSTRRIRTHESRARRPRTEEEWLDRKEQAAREALRVCVAGLADDLGSALNLPASVRRHALFEIALERAGQVLGSDPLLGAIESAVAPRAAGLFSGADPWRRLFARLA